jgi:tetratricopeptide (TPR) repeat protein
MPSTPASPVPSLGGETPCPCPSRIRPPARVIIGGLLLCLFLTWPVLAGDAFAPASRHILKGEYRSARAEFLSYAGAHPRNRLTPVALLAAARLSLDPLADPAGARAACEILLTRHGASPWAPEAARIIGAGLESDRAWAEAGAAYQQALDLATASQADPAPFDADWINDVAMHAADCFYRLGDRQRVIGMYEQVLQPGSSLNGQAVATTRARLADCYSSAGQPEKAARQYAAILNQHPFRDPFAEALAHRARIEPYLQLDWDALEAYAGVRQSFRSGDFAQARVLCEQALGGQLDDELALAVEMDRTFAETLLAEEYATGLHTLRALERQQSQGYDNPLLGQRLTFLEGIVELEKRVERDPAHLASWIDLGGRYRQAQALEKAAGAFRRAVAIEPTHPQAALELGHALAAAGRAEEATAAYDAFLAHAPDNTQALNRIGYVYLSLGNPDAALPYFERYAALAPDEENAHDSLGEGYLQAGRLEDARREYERAVELNPGFANSFFMLGEIYRRLGETRKARQAYQRFVELAPHDARGGLAREAIEELAP